MKNVHNYLGESNQSTANSIKDILLYLTVSCVTIVSKFHLLKQSKTSGNV